LPISDCRLPIANFRLPISDCLFFRGPRSDSNRQSAIGTRQYRAIFIDRDGTLNEDIGYVILDVDSKISKEAFEILKGVKGTLKARLVY